MTKFKKGQSGNPEGRPRGAKNRVNENLKSKIEDFLDSKVNDLDTIWEELDPRDRIMFISKLLEYTVPKLRAQDVNISEYGEFSTSDLRQIANEILNKNA